MPNPKNIAGQIVEQLIDAGVQHVFGVGGANIEDMFAAVQRRRPELRAVLAKHEHGAASAAAAYAKLRGGLGVVMATSGAGAMNLTHGLAEARASRIALLAIVGEPPSDLQGRGAFQDTSGTDGGVDALAVLGAAAGFALRVARPEDTLRLLDQALAHIAAETRPAVLLIAKDVQAAKAPSVERESVLPEPSIPQASMAQLADSAQKLTRGPCLIIAGEEVVRARARSELAQLVAALDARIAVTPDARDAFDNRDPHFIGVAGAMGSERVAEALLAARTCLIVGTRMPLLARMGLESSLHDVPCIAIGREPPYVSGHHHIQHICELRSGLRLLLAALAPSQPKDAGAALSPAPAAESGELDSASALARIERALGDEDIVLVDAGNTGASATHYLRAPRHGRWLLAMGMAGMGYTFGAAVGAACASGKRCWVLAGDGAFYMHGFEIHTAIEHALPITYVIFDNRAHGMCLVREQLLLHDNGGYNSFRPAQLAAGLAAMFPGLPTRSCTDLPQLEAALEQLRNVSGPSVIVLQLEHVEVPPFVALRRADPQAKTVSRGGSHASQ